jgi:hypothetical protein
MQYFIQILVSVNPTLGLTWRSIFAIFNHVNIVWLGGCVPENYPLTGRAGITSWNCNNVKLVQISLVSMSAQLSKVTVHRMCLTCHSLKYI